MRASSFSIMAGLFLLPSLTAAQPPRYHAEFLGAFFPGRISENGQIIGTTTVGGNERGFIVNPGHPLQLLPLPNGMISSNAIDISEQGVVVGAAGAYYSPEFYGRAVAWAPDEGGEYAVHFLGELPGQSISRAMAVNGLGDIVGYSSDGTYRYPVLFTNPGSVLNLTSTGVFDPMDINDHRVLVDRSFTVKRLDLNTMVVQDLGVPPGSYLATSAVAINESGQVGGLAILNGGGDCDRVAARYTDGVGWQVFSGCGRGNGVSDMNEQGDVIMSLNVAPYVRFEGLGTFLVEDLILNDIGHWYVSNFSGLTINSAKQMAVFASNQETGQQGALLLTPEDTADVDGPGAALSSMAPELDISPNPFSRTAGIHYELPRPSRVSLAVLDVTGRAVRRLVDGENQLPGTHLIWWDGRGDGGGYLASGIYRLRLEADGRAQVGGIVLLR